MTVTAVFSGEEMDRLIEVIHRSLSIRKHFDFFRWLQADLRPWVPHDLLVAAWGDFAAGRLSFDVSSNLPGMRTRSVCRDCAIAELMDALFWRWIKAGETRFDISPLSSLCESLPGADSCLARWDGLRSVVVHGMRDRRGGHDCLYAFFADALPPESGRPALDLLLPFIDGALRRVEHLPAVSLDDAVPISLREKEIMAWLMAGKTNDEIGLILGISSYTVKNHLKRIYRKLGVFSRAQAVARYAARAPAAAAGG